MYSYARTSHFLALILLGNLMHSANASVPYSELVGECATRHGLDESLVWAVMAQESGGKVRAVSHKGAAGLMQLMPATAERFGVTDRFDPRQNVMAGCAYLRWLLDRYRGDVSLALAGYNAGEGAVDRYNGIPPYRETKNYVRSIMKALGRPVTISGGVSKSVAARAGARLDAPTAVTSFGPALTWETLYAR